MTQQLYQQFRQADKTQKVPVRTLNILGTSDTSPPQCIAFYPDKTLDVFTDEPQFDKGNTVTHCSTRGELDIRTLEDPRLTSSRLVPFVAHNVEQTTMIKSENQDIQRRMLSLLLKAEDKEDKILEYQERILKLQLEAREKDDKILALQMEAKEKDDKMLVLQLEAKVKDDKMLEMQQQALDRLALIYKQGTAILTQTYELHEYPIPRLFIVLPKNSSKFDPSSHLNDQFRLYFLCECGEHTKVFGSENTDITHNIHLAKHEGYDLQRPKEFVQKYGRYMLTLLDVIKHGITFASVAVPALAAVKAPSIIDIFKDPLKAVSQSDIDHSIKYLQGLVDTNLKDQVNSSTSWDALEGADLRHLEEFIKDKDKHRVLGNLYRIVTPDGHVKWVCIDHYSLTYMEKEQLAFAKAVEANGGSYEPQLGQAVVKLGSKIRTKEFFDALAKARRIYDLDIVFDWECGKTDLEILEEALEKSRVSILRLNLRRFRTSLGRKILPTSTRYDILLRIMELPNMRMIHIALPREYIKISEFQPKRLSRLHQLSLDIARNTMGVKEIKALAKALETNSTLTSLDFWGNSIGDSGAQVLSVALKMNATLVSLNLQHNSIKGDGVQALSEALKINSTLITLNLRDNSVGDNGAQALSQALKINSTLITLNLRDNSVGDSGAQALSQALKINSTVLNLDLKGNSIGFGGALAMFLARRINPTPITINLENNLIKNSAALVLSKALRINSTLTILDLVTNSIGDNGAQALSEALKINSTLTSLDLDTNSIGDNGAQALSEALKINSTLTILDLNRNSIGGNGAQALSEALKINSTLTKVSLNANSIEDNGVRALSEALKINSTLNKLDLDTNSIGDNGAQALSEALKINSTLTALVLKTNSIGDNGVRALSEALKINSTLTKLSLNANSIGDNGVRALSEALKINSTLNKLDLDTNSIGDNGAQALSEALKINSTLTALGLNRNSIGGHGAQALSEALKINSTLTILGLNMNSIGDNGAQALSGALKINSTLTKLSLNANSIGDNGHQALSKALKINSTLTYLDLDTNSIGDNGAHALEQALIVEERKPEPPAPVIEKAVPPPKPIKPIFQKFPTPFASAQPASVSLRLTVRRTTSTNDSPVSPGAGGETSSAASFTGVAGAAGAAGAPTPGVAPPAKGVKSLSTHFGLFQGVPASGSNNSAALEPEIAKLRH
ncbi:hypothetical protein BGZ99_010307 [Dissophora globulifera]|uniref:RNI-like protein n=1 Tax=Dissophora globulifera TaxID=979702 RepID=A0A9P6R529_9FUNG|nr:hypothetical protein BGZ99_010307 [Dissophora globulifera]